MTKKEFLLTLGILLLCLSAHSQPINRDMTSTEVKKQRTTISNTLGKVPPMFEWWRSESERKIRLTKVNIIPSRERIELDFNAPFAQIGIREQLVAQWEQMVRDTLCDKTRKDYSNVQVALYCQGVAIEKFIPNAYRKKFIRDIKRTAKPTATIPLTRPSNRPVYGAGLEMRHIALWPSHGYHFDFTDSTWKFQRPALFETIEDIHSFEYCYNYLIPMLENAGAIVISPRERSPQREEIIVDNDLSHAGCKITQLTGKWHKEQGGFLRRDSLMGENPFSLGTYLTAQWPASIEYRATLPHAGRYGITVSYHTSEQNCSRVIYRVAHRADTTDIEVNQRIMGSTWVYLGEFDLTTTPTVTIISSGEGSVTADAVRFGGGMGSVIRGGRTSGLPRWAEAARYSMQYSGVPKEVYAIGALENEQDHKRKATDPIDDDYVDDYKSRGEWTNWVKEVKKVPLDLAIALHTNAGTNDTIFGSMTIHYSNAGRENFSNDKSKFTSRDLSDLVLTQIVNDIRSLHTPQWTRRSIYDKRYSEVYRPDIPAVIVEMFSHQDPIDMSYARQPQFRFDMARAIYKGILRFLADRYGQTYIVQPLPIGNMTMNIRGDNTVRLSWDPTVDSLESTATPTQYKLYTRIADGGFDDGVVVREPFVDLPIVRDRVIRSYRVTALNEGGESFASETLSCGFVEGSASAEIISNEYHEKSHKRLDWSYVGQIYDLDPTSPFIDNENPGYGASKTDRATLGLEVNSFDNTTHRGEELLRKGRSYISHSAHIN